MNFEIKSDIPVGLSDRVGTMIRVAAKTMKKGDCIEVPKSSARAARQAAVRYIGTKKYKTATSGEVLRIWKVA